MRSPGDDRCYTPLILEIFLLFGLLLLLPFVPWPPLWILGALVLVLPGTFATWKGAPYVPTSKKLLKRMIELAAIKPGELVVDLGCGDGRLVFAAAERGAVAVGYECSLPMFLIARIRSWFHRRSRIECKNFWKQDYKNADVIFCYLLQDSMQTFKKTVWPQLKPGARVVSHAFTMEGVEPRYEEEKVVVYVK